MGGVLRGIEGVVGGLLKNPMVDAFLAPFTGGASMFLGPAIGSFMQANASGASTSQALTAAAGGAVSGSLGMMSMTGTGFLSSMSTFSDAGSINAVTSQLSSTANQNAAYQQYIMRNMGTSTSYGLSNNTNYFNPPPTLMSGGTDNISSGFSVA